jgi:cob(I)alamin adenosyltransferase
MGNRISKVVTRTGDSGETGLADGSRLAKSSPRIHAIGDVDELNSQLGVLLAEALPDNARVLLGGIQNDLFDLGGELAWPGHPLMTPAHVARLETAVEEFNASLPPLKEFVLPGGSRAAALAHVCRTVCRRAERAVAALGMGGEPGMGGEINPETRRYLNRLSDLLFVLARWLNREQGIGEPVWRGVARG